MNFEDEKPGDLLRERKIIKQYLILFYLSKKIPIFFRKRQLRKKHILNLKERKFFLLEREKMINNKIKCMNTMKPPNFSSFFL